ncbi:MAG: hypothetical protein IPO76_10115 [Elusimicrobia bacterium]|nr:hypothetical protein [Elusimicrobiota bacterium]
MNRHAAAVVLGALALAGCASLEPAAFRRFQSTVAAGHQAMEREMARDVEWTREADAQVLATDKDAALSALTLKGPGDNGWAPDNPPAHWTARRTLDTLRAMNGAFGAYAALLTDLADGRDVEEDAVDAVGDDLNDAARDARRALGELRPADRATAAGGAAFAAESLRRCLRARRAGKLADALRENQPLAVAHAALGRALVDIVRADLKAAYADQAAAIHEKWNDKRSPGRITLGRSLFNLNDEFSAAMASLDDLAVFYDHLPAAHADLRARLRKERTAGPAARAWGRSAGAAARRARTLEASR